MCYFKEKSAYILFIFLFIAIFIASPQFVYSQIDPNDFDKEPPSVVESETFPENGQTGVPIDSSIEVVFSESMDTLFHPLSIPNISGVTTWLDYILIFTPFTLLDYNETYQVTIDNTLAMDLSGNPLENPYQWSFVTELSPWTHFDHIQDLSLDQNNVKLILGEDNGEIWVVVSSSGPSDDLFIFDGFDPNGFYQINESLGKINALEQDSTGNIWVCSESDDPGLGGVYVFDGVDWVQYNNPADANFPDNTIKCLTIDSEDNVWAGSGSSGIYRFDGTSWKNYNMINSGLSNHWVSNIKADDNDYIWIATVFGGIEGFDPQANEWNNTYISNFENQFNTSFPFVSEIVPGSENIWIATDLGLLKYDIASDDWELFTQIDGNIPETQLNSIAFDRSNDILWVGTDEGLIRFDGENGESIVFGDVEPDVLEIALDAYGNTWIGTTESLSKYDSNPPVLISFSPGANKKNVTRNTNITIVFSEPMDKTSVISALGSTPSFSYTPSWNASSTRLTINPKSNLRDNKKYTVNVGKKATDKQGNPLAQIHSSSFTTEKSTSAGPIPGGPSFPQFPQFPSVPQFQFPQFRIPQFPTVPQFQFPQFRIPQFPTVPQFPPTGFLAFPRTFGTFSFSSSPFRGVGTLVYPRF